MEKKIFFKTFHFVFHLEGREWVNDDYQKIGQTTSLNSYLIIIKCSKGSELHQMQHNKQSSFRFLTISRCWWFDNKIFPAPKLKKSSAVRKTKTNSDSNVKTSGCYATRRHRYRYRTQRFHYKWPKLYNRAKMYSATVRLVSTQCKHTRCVGYGPRCKRISVVASRRIVPHACRVDGVSDEPAFVKNLHSG